METGKPGLASAPVLIGSIAEQTEKRMDMQSPLTAVYIQTVAAAAVAPPPTPAPRPAATPEPPALHLPMPQLYSKETLPLLTLHIVGGLQSQPGLSLAAAAAAGTPAAKARSAGKHVCPHCGRDCMKPSVLEKHLRCHTGERPYPCNTCGVSFKTQSNLYKHKRTQAHARLSYESEQSSVDSSSGSRDLHTPGSSLEERGREAGSPERGAGPAQSARTAPPKLSSREELPAEPPPDAQARAEAATAEERRAMDREKAPAGHARHLPLQRQEATLFSKQWESSVCRGKSQSHESTDSGFSESSDAGLLLHEHSTDSLAESTQEPAGGGGAPAPLKDPGREREQRSLEERISKLISENSALMEDKHLENVRPRKTVLSKQGSIDLPMPYTYKDSFHFDMRRAPNVASHRSRNPGLCSSVPTQRSGSVEHAPLTRSHSLPFSVSLLQPERASPSPAQRGHYATTARRGSAGQIHPGAAVAAVRPGGQHSPAHRPLVRQTAVDCNHATDALCASSSVEEAGCDGEPSGAKFRRKKAQKFAYNKWYMYGDGTFRKLYAADKGGEPKGRKSANPESEPAQGLQKRSSTLYKEPASPPAKLCALDFRHDRGQSIAPLHRNLSLPLLPSPSAGAPVARTTERTVRGESERPSHEGDSSDRKKQRTEDEIACPVEMETDLNTPATLSLPLPLPPLATTRKLETNLTFVNLQTNHAAPKEPLFPPALINANSRLVSGSPGAPATRPPLAANNNFLPKYQLKLPNAAEPDSALTKEKPAGAEASSAAAPSSVAVQTSSPAPTPGQHPVTLPSTCDKNASSQVPLPPAVATFSQGANAAANFAALRSSPAETTITTTCLHDHRTRLCSASPLNQPPRPSAVQWLSPAADHHTPAPSLGPPTAHAQEAAQPSNPGDRLGGPGSNPPAVPCHVVPFDSLQPAAHNVFHVHTADLQICLQIISDEQLALIEPQIERQASGARSQKHDGGNVLSLQSKSPKAGLTDAEAGGPQPNPQTQTLQHTESIKPPLSVCVGTPPPPPPPPNLNVSQSAHPAPASVSAQPQQPPRAPSLSKATPPSAGAGGQGSATSQVPLTDGQNKCRNQGGSCKESTITSTQTRPTPQQGLDHGNAASCWTASSTDKCEIPRQAAHCGNTLESTSTGSADPSQHAEAEPSQHSQHGAGWAAPHHFTSGTSHVPPQRPTDTQHPTAGWRGGASPPGRAAPDQPQTGGCGGGGGGGGGGGTPALAAVWPGSGSGSEAGEVGRGGPGARRVATAAGDGDGDCDGGASCIGGDAVAGRQRGDAPPACKHTVPSDTRETREEGGEVRRDLPQTDSGTHSETPPPAPPPFHFSGPQQSGGQQTTIREQAQPPSTPSPSQLPQTSSQFEGDWRKTPMLGSLDTTLADVTGGYRGDCGEVMWSEAGGCGERAAPGRSAAAAAACSGEAIFLAAQLHGEQSGECLSGAVRPVPSCHGDGEDASSSDDEGKLIIEL